MITEQLPFLRNYLDLSILFNERSFHKQHRCEDCALLEFVCCRLAKGDNQSFDCCWIVSNFVFTSRARAAYFFVGVKASLARSE